MKSCATRKYAIVHYGENESDPSPCYLRKPENEDGPVEIRFSFDIRKALLSGNFPYMRNMCADFNSQLAEKGHKLGGHIVVAEVIMRTVES